MDKDVERELAALKATVTSFGERLERLEKLSGEDASAGAGKAVSEDFFAIPPEPTPTAPSEPTPKAPPVTATLDPGSTAKPSPSESLETRIGLYWLNRLGVASLVIGVALLLLYSFQYFGAVAKVATGVAVSAALIGLGEWIERKKGLSWYAGGVIGGGWALAYFTVYAMHFVESVRVITSPVADAVLLLAVAAAATVHSVHRRSEIIAVLAVVMGFITVPLARVSDLNPIALTMLAATAAVLAAKMQWQRLYLWGIVAAYISGMAAEPGDFDRMKDFDRLVARLSYFGSYWALFSAALFFFKAEVDRGCKRLVVGTLINGMGFLAAMYSPVWAVLKANQYWFVLALGSVYGVSCSEFKRKGLESVYATHLIMGLTFVTAAVPMALSGDWYVCLWTVEVAALAYLGLEYGLAGMRWFAMALAVVSGIGILADLFADASVNMSGLVIPLKCVMAFVGSVSYGLAARFCRAPRFLESQGAGERRWFFYLYFLGAAFFAWLLPPLTLYYREGGVNVVPEETANGALPFLWALESAFMVVTGLNRGSRFVRVVGMLGFVVVGWSLLILMQSWTWWGTLAVVGCLYLVGYAYRLARFRPVIGSERALSSWYSVAGSIVVTILIGQKLSGAWTSTAWAVEGLVLLLAGFRLPDRWFRVSGLVVFALVLMKLLFVDLSGAATVQRILSFIGAGLVLLLSSYGYGKFAGKLVSGDADRS